MQLILRRTLRVTEARMVPGHPTLDRLDAAHLRLQELLELRVEQHAVLEGNYVSTEHLLHFVAYVCEAHVGALLENVKNFGGNVVQDLVVQRTA